MKTIKKYDGVVAVTMVFHALLLLLLLLPGGGTWCVACAATSEGTIRHYDICRDRGLCEPRVLDDTYTYSSALSTTAYTQPWKEHFEVFTSSMGASRKYEKSADQGV